MEYHDSKIYFAVFVCVVYVWVWQGTVKVAVVISNYFNSPNAGNLNLKKGRLRNIIQVGLFILQQTRHIFEGSRILIVSKSD